MTREILVMDCEERETFWITLKSDYKILFATTALEGLNMLSENVGIVFLSKKLPDMNSIDVFRLIKEEYPATEVIIITSCGTEETCTETFRKGTRDFVMKPLEADEILEMIRILIDMEKTSRRHQRLSLPMETIQYERYPDIPSHLVNGILKVRDFISQNYSESLSLPDACKMASTSKTYFCRFFKSITGHSLRTYHHVVRIRIAEDLLRNKNLSIKEVAQQLGYNDTNYFSTIFKKITGLSPRQRQTFDQHPPPHKMRERELQLTE